MSEEKRPLPYRSEIEHFVNSSVWRYIAEEISTLMLNASLDNDELDPYKDAAQMARNQGLIKLGKMILDMPAQMAEEADGQANNEPQEEE